MQVSIHPLARIATATSCGGSCSIQWLICIAALSIVKLTISSAEPSNNNNLTGDGETFGQMTTEMIPDKFVIINSRKNRQGFIVSPGYPRSAPWGLVANVLLEISNESGSSIELDTVRLTAIDLNLQTANTCAGESINVYLVEQDDFIDPSKMVYSFCGSGPLRPILVSSKRIVVQYSCDEFVATSINGQSRGFKLKYEFLNYKAHLFDGCEQPNHFKCRNRKCISNDLKCNKFDDCGDASDEDQFTPCPNLPSIPYRTDYLCGMADLDDQPSSSSEVTVSSTRSLLTNRIVGGRESSSHLRRLPQVSIQILGMEPISHICGGVLIHPMFVLTSAHCFQDGLTSLSYKLIFGLNDLRLVEGGHRGMSTEHHQVRYAVYIRTYPSLSIDDGQIPRFAESNLELANKISIVELNAPIKMTSSVWPACLPHLGETIQAERECSVMGYGETRGSGGAFALKRTIQTVKHSNSCRSVYNNITLDDYTMICAKNRPHEGPCSGDSGGPLLCLDDGDNRPVNVSESRGNKFEPGQPGDLIRYLTIKDDDDDYSSADGQETSGRISSRRRKWSASDRYTVHGITSFTTYGNIGGGFCALESVPIVYARLSTRVEWIISVMKTSLARLSKADQHQDPSNQTAFFGYMFRTGRWQHENFTRLMTVNNA